MPSALEQLVLKCLEKKPADRWQSAEELLPQLEALTTPSGGMTPTGTMPVTTSARSGSRRKLLLLSVAAFAVIAVCGFFLLRGSSDEGRPLDPNAVAVMPFRISGTARSDTVLTDLREGMLDILDATLTGDVGLRAIDPRSVLVAWGSQTDDETVDLPLERMLPIATGLGAGRILVGGIVGARERLTINATLHAVDGPENPIEVTTTGPYDSLPQLIDRFVTQLLSLASGEEAASLQSFVDTPLEALQAYLAGTSALRRAQPVAAVRFFDRALELDSTFALAAVQLGAVGQLPGNTDTDAAVRGNRLAWSLRDRLSERDRAVLVARLGRNYPAPRTGRQRLQDMEPALELAADRWDVWSYYAFALSWWGEFLDIPDWRQRLNAVLDRAWELDSTHIGSAMTQVVAIDWSDTTRVRRAQRAVLRFETSSWQVIGRWCAALALGDSAELEATRPMLGNGQLTTGAAGHLTVYNGYPLDHWERAIADFSQNAMTQRERLQVMEERRKLARIRGRIREATYRADSLATSWTQLAASMRLELIMQPLFGDGGDSAAAATAEAIRARPRARNISDIVYPELLKVAQTGDTSGTRAVIESAREIAEARQSITTLPFLLEAVLEGMDRNRTAYPAALRLDSLLAEGINARMSVYLLARLYSDRGQYELALHMVRRRIKSNFIGWHEAWPAFLREEGRLAALTGDTEGAISAYARFLELRTDPDPGLMQEQVDEVRAELARLTGEQGGRE